MIVPCIKGADLVISFLNHFLIKRGIDSVIFKITPHLEGDSEPYSLTYKIEDAAVFTFNLSTLFKDCGEILSFECEFLSTQNIGVPYPAVIVNHITEDSHNIVHSYCRQLNSILEERKILAYDTDETNFDYINNDSYETFFVFQNGMFAKEIEHLDIYLIKNGSNDIRKEAINIGKSTPFGRTIIGLSDLAESMSYQFQKVLEVIRFLYAKIRNVCFMEDY